MRNLLLLVVACILGQLLTAQPITGHWRGTLTKGSGLRAKTAKLEVKIVKQGDSLYGTSIYYLSAKQYVQYSIAGFFNLQHATVQWQDVQILDIQPRSRPADFERSKNAMTIEASFSCPRPDVMMLDGVAGLSGEEPLTLHLQKTTHPTFESPWDYVIDGYFTGKSEPSIIDSVRLVASKPLYDPWAKPEAPAIVAAKPQLAPGAATPDPQPTTPPSSNTSQNPPVAKATLPAPSTTRPAADKPAAATATTARPQPQTPQQQPARTPNKPQPAIAAPPTATTKPASTAPAPKPITPPPPAVAKALPTTAQNPAPPTTAKPSPAAIPLPTVQNTEMKKKFEDRTKVVQSEINISGSDSIALYFYDNAEVDGDSISLFLNGIQLFQHVRLSAAPYIFKLPVAQLPAVSELTMVAENLGAIPPNTAYMMAEIKGQRHGARIESTEKSSGVIRLIKKE